MASTIDSTLRVRRPTTVQQVIGHLKELIVRGEWTHGQKLPPEKELTAQLGVSRTVLREAVQALAALEILVPRQGDGVYVSSLELPRLLKPLEFALTLDPATVEHAYGARLAIEPSIARVAAERMPPALKTELQQLVVRAEAATQDARAFAAIDEQMHALLARATGNPFLTTLMNSLGELARASRGLTCAVPGAPASALQDWRVIVRAVEAANGRAAFEAMERHLTGVLLTWQQARQEQARGLEGDARQVRDRRRPSREHRRDERWQESAG